MASWLVLTECAWGGTRAGWIGDSKDENGNSILAVALERRLHMRGSWIEMARIVEGRARLSRRQECRWNWIRERLMPRHHFVFPPQAHPNFLTWSRRRSSATRSHDSHCKRVSRDIHGRSLWLNRLELIGNHHLFFGNCRRSHGEDMSCCTSLSDNRAPSLEFWWRAELLSDLPPVWQPGKSSCCPLRRPHC